jgi:DNA helicase-2/ATP-dependent DNA helicase PcrA
MINKFPGTCHCGTRVEAQAGTAVKVGNKWEVRCAAHAAVAAPAMATAGPDISNEISEPVSADYTLLSGHAASAYQAAVFDHFRFGRGSVIVTAVAGSGKTTTMKNALRYLPDWMHVQMFAFNTGAADQLNDAIEELKGRGEKTYKHVRAGTFHSVGLGAVIRSLNLPKAQIKIEDGKCRRLLRERLGDDGIETYEMYGSFALALVKLAKGQGIGALVPDTDDRWFDLVDHHGLYLDNLEASVETGIELARRLLGWSNEAAKTGWLDFDDQLYLVILWKLRLWQNHVVICDEAQDTNPVRRAMLHLALKDGGRLYAVGDPKQSIYGFTGASTDAMDLIAKEFRTRDLPLTVSYRCARSIVERAQTWVPYIEAAETAPLGVVSDDLPLYQALAQVTAADAILCRQTAPLVSVAYGLIARGRACQILGKEIGQGLVNLIGQQKARGIDRLIEKLSTWRDREAGRFIAKGEETKAEAIGDRVNCILIIIEALAENERTIPALIAKIQGMFADLKDGEKQNVLTLCTQHKAKGKEWDTVVILRPELNPSKAARQEWQEEQEINLMYVAATRAKSHLIYAVHQDMSLDAPKEGV